MAPRRVLVLGGHSGSLIGFRGAMLRALVAQGDEVYAAAPGADPEVIRQLGEWNVAYRTVAFDRTGLDPRRDLAAFRDVRRLIRDLRPDLVFTYNVKPILHGSLAARWAGVPARFAMVEGLGRAFAGGSFLGSMMEWMAASLYRFALQGCRAVFFLNPDDLGLFRAREILPPGTEAVRLDGIGVDLQHFGPRPVPAGPPVFLLVARLLAAKGIATFAEAAGLVRQRYPEARFRILGGFESGGGAITREQLSQWERDGAVEYLGVTDDVRPFLEAATVFVLPSYYREGLPRTSLEAMSTGRAVITTDWPGCREAVIDGETGTLVPVKDPPRLAEVMIRYIEEPALAVRQGAAGRALAEARFDEVVVTRKMLDVLGSGSQ